MTSPLDSLVGIGVLKPEAPNRAEFDGLVKSGSARLQDAKRKELSTESRFDLAYNAAHALSLAALRRLGYRADKRYVVFQALQHTLGLPPAVGRRLDNCHRIRNQAEYEGVVEVDDRILADLLDAAETVADALSQVAPPPA